MRFLIFLLILLNACSIRMLALVETEDATKGKVHIKKEQLDEEKTTTNAAVPQPVLPSNTN